MANPSFKSYSRGTRILTIENNFKNGQNFTKAPLDDGAHRVILNYDINNEGKTLANRAGYRTTMLCANFTDTDAKPKFTENISISNGTDIVEEDGSNYRLLVADQYSDSDKNVIGNLYECDSEFWVIPTKESEHFDFLDKDDITCRDLYSVPVPYELDNADAEKPKSYYTVPSTINANGFEVKDKTFMAKHIGCFAYSNDYYSFNNKGQLMRSKYVPKSDENPKAVYISEILKAKEITAAQAINSGFNMLADKPFDFGNKVTSAGGVIKLTGVLVYDSAGNMVPYPLLNTPYTIKIFYEIPTGVSYKITVHSVEAGTSEEKKVFEKTFSTTDGKTELKIEDFTSGFSDLKLYIRAYKGSATEPEKMASVSLNFSKVDTKSTANRPLINYDLSKATGMVYWKNKIWLYGLAQDPNVLFSSDFNNPDYFPYPNAVDIFDEPVMFCTPFNETLLVFTRSQIIQLTLTTDGYWTKKVLQSNLNFSESDANFIQVVKNMLFFKSGSYYYMIVPKTLSLQNELALAPVSKSINYLLDDMSTNVKEILEAAYEYTGPIELMAHYNYLDYEDIHNVYTFKTINGLLLNFVLLYNTVDRSWRMYTYESETIYTPIRQDATKQSVLMTPAYLKSRKDSVDTNLIGVQFIEASKTEVSDLYIPKTFVFDRTDTGYTVEDDYLSKLFEAQHMFKNFQILDTGYRNDNIDFNKRYRELQIKFNNVNAEKIKFFTEFFISGETRISRFQYQTEHITDPTSPDFGLIYISRTPVENLEMPGQMVLAENLEDLNSWELDSSRFPEISFWKARLKVSGKGYTPRFRLICRTESKYEVLGYAWVYRLMYAR